MHGELHRLLDSAVEALGYELVAVELVGGHRGKVLRLYIDLPGGIGIGDCERVSRQVSAFLDVEDPIPGHYTLEVSSPGLDRPLVKLEHFSRVVGQDVSLRTRDYVLGRRKFTGRLEAVEDDKLLLDIDGEVYVIAYDQVESARLKPEY